jgi:hypothetical protein
VLRGRAPRRVKSPTRSVATRVMFKVADRSSVATRVMFKVADRSSIATRVMFWHRCHGMDPG